ncbi:hypothetical protein O6R08_04035 [Cutibacterium equinum]|uniref:Transposase n=1 Tax=Cutibacterium equinum TaxID=3016342 RepID=A0ABY7R042_9ACTN|nr:hypothetical protein [Cutibacterium equinum]WCC80662.1 hypothetical protein O6R08_04035 [Cutibacterium equinum]
MYHETRPEYEGDWPAVVKVAQLVGVSTRRPCGAGGRQDEVDQGQRRSVSSEESSEAARLKRENAELRRANAILKAASAFFGGRALPAGAVIVDFIREHAGRREADGLRWDAESICQILRVHGIEIAPSAYYEWRDKPFGKREQRV